jgi:hypothetical protein
LQINDTLNPSEPDALSPESLSSPEHWIHVCLHPAEVAYGMSQPSDVARNTFYLGRLAMRQLVTTQDSILKDSHGRPMLPMGYLGSISHKKNTGVALISKTVDSHSGIGVDLEHSFSSKKSIAKRVLTEREMNELGRIEVSVMWFLRYRCFATYMLVTQHDVYAGCNEGRGSFVTILSKREFIQGHASVDLSVCWLSRSRGNSLSRWNGNGSLESKVRYS